MKIATRITSPLIAALGALALVACGDSAGPAGTGQAVVTLASDAAAANRVPDAVRLSVGDVPTDAVSSLALTLTRIDVHVAGADDELGEGEGEELGEGEAGEDESGWITLEVSLAEPVDLLDLAALGSIELAAGAVPAGRITQVRLFFDTMELTLDTDVDVSNQTVPAGVYAVTVPSALQTGLKINQVNATVGDGETATVALEIGVDASIGTLVYNANGFQLSPVMTLK